MPPIRSVCRFAYQHAVATAGMIAYIRKFEAAQENVGNRHRNVAAHSAASRPRTRNAMYPTTAALINAPTSELASSHASEPKSTLDQSFRTRK